MPTRFYDPNNTEQQRLLRAAQNGGLESRRFTDSVGRSGIETIDGDLRMRRYDSGQTHFEQRGPGGEMRAFGPTTSPRDLVTPPTGPVIAPDRTAADRLARAMADNGSFVDRGPQFAAQAAAARMGFTREDMPRGWQGNVHDFDHERSFGTAAAIGARARGFGGPPTAIETFGSPAERERLQRAVEDERMAYLEREAGLSPLGIAGSAAGGSAGRAAAARELESIRLRRAQEDARQSADLARREGFANDQTVAGITAAGRQAAAAAAAAGQVDAAKEQAKGREAAAGKRAEGIVAAQRIESEANKEIAKGSQAMQREQNELRKQEIGRPIALGGGAAAIQNEDGTWTIEAGEPTADGKPQGVTLKPGESFYNPYTRETFVAPGADRTSIEAEISTILELMSRAIDEKRRAPLQKQLDAARDRLAKLPGGTVAPSSAAPAPAAGGFGFAPIWNVPR